MQFIVRKTGKRAGGKTGNGCKTGKALGGRQARRGVRRARRETGKAQMRFQRGRGRTMVARPQFEAVGGRGVVVWECSAIQMSPTSSKAKGGAAMPKPEKRELDASSKAGVVPAKAAKLGSEGSAKTMGSGGSGGGQASAPTHKKPRLPSASGADKDSPAHPILKHIIPYVNQELEIYLRTEKTLKENEHLVNLLPLTIESVEKAGVSYKHHWLPTSCKKSMEQSGLYEAGGVLFWIDPETTGSFLIPAVQPTWSSVCSVADNQFDTVGVSGSNNATTRIVFPVPLSAKWDGPISADTYPTRLTILGGHAFIWAWYVKMFHALDGREKIRSKNWSSVL